ncbi:MAG: alpha/beta hydrolase [Cellulomonadaceae bacterium]
MKKNRDVLGLVIALVLCVVGAAGQMVTQSDYGRVDVQEMSFTTETGNTLAAKAFVPETATEDNKAPAIVIAHGGNDDKQLMSRYAIELAKRGYVAVAIDMYSHGESSWLPDSEWLTAGRGVYDMVRNVVTWPNVDASEVSLLGYSRGGRAAGEALEIDNAELNVVKNIYLIFSDPIYRDAEGFTDVYGARNIAVLADLYDEFFFTEKVDDGSVYSNDANRFLETLSSPVDYIQTSIAQSFLHFGAEPEGLEARSEGVVYEQDYDGVTGTREIRSINQDHMAGHYSLTVMTEVVDFFDRVEPTGSGATGVSLVATYDVFSFIAMAGMLMFVVYGVAVIVRRSSYFSAIVMKKPVIEKISGRKDLLWQWGTVVAGVLFNVVVIWGLNVLKFSSWFDSVFRASKFVYVPMLTLLCSIFLLGVSVVSYWRRKKEGHTNDVVRMQRILPGRTVVVRTALLAVVVVFAFYLISFVGNYVFGANFKWTMWSFQTLQFERLAYALLILPMLGLFYVVSSISNDGLGYTSAYGKNKTVNALVTAFMNALPLLVVMAYIYGYFRVTGWNPMFGGNAAAGNSIYTLPVIVFVMIFVSRLIFQKTGNVYLGGFIAGLITSIVTVSVSEIRVPEADAPFTLNWTMMAFLVASYVIFVVALRYFGRLRRDALVEEGADTARSTAQDRVSVES